MEEQAHKLWHISNYMCTEPAITLAKHLVESTFADKVFFANSGGEANEAALKLARRYAFEKFGKEKSQIISFYNSFHGRTLFDVTVGGQAKYCEGFGYGVVRELTGHGIGTSLHQDPEVLNYGKAGHGYKLKPGMAICIEPMITLGRKEIEMLNDGWTIITRDGKPAAHYENTILITEDGPVMTTYEEDV